MARTRSSSRVATVTSLAHRDRLADRPIGSQATHSLSHDCATASLDLSPNAGPLARYRWPADESASFRLHARGLPSFDGASGDPDDSAIDRSRQPRLPKPDARAAGAPIRIASSDRRMSIGQATVSSLGSGKDTGIAAAREQES